MNIKRNTGRRIVILVLLLLGTGVAAAQTGSLKIQVFDEDGELPGATVTLSSNRGYIVATTLITDESGVVDFQILRAGLGYTIEVSFPGFSTVRKSEIRIPINRTVVEGIRLAAELKETVRVVVERDVVDLEKVETSTRFSDEFIQDLPVPGRFYQNVLTLAPGVQDADGDGNPNVHGSRSRDFKAVVSGVSNVDPLTGQQMNQINPNSIEEMEVITAGAGVEFGRAQGGFAHIIQKQGSNDFEGLVELLYRSDELDGDAFSASRGSGSGPVSYRTYQPSFQISGPIIKDKLWYRLSHELIDREDPVDITTSVEVVKTRWQINSDQLTWQVTPRNKLALQYQYDPLEVTNLGISSIRGPESSVRSRYGGDTYSLTWTAPYSTRLLVDSTLSYQDTEFSLAPTAPGTHNTCYPDRGDGTANSKLTGAFCFDAINTRYSGAYNVDHLDHRQRFTMKSTANLYGGRFWGMSHRIKLGFSIENERYFRNLTVRPEMTLSYKQAFTDPESEDPKDPNDELPTNDDEPLTWGAPPLKAVHVARVSIPESVATTSTGTNWALFVEDQVKPLANLSVTMGLRVDSEQLNGGGRTAIDPEADYIRYLEGYSAIETATGLDPTGTDQLNLIVANFVARGDILDFYTQVSNASGLPLIACSGLCSSSFHLKTQQQPDSLAISNRNVSPFLSVAWDPWSDGKTKLSFTVGRHYNSTVLSVPLEEVRPVTADVAIGCSGYFCQVGDTSIVPNITEVRDDLRTPYQDEWVVALERELFPETMARVTYINRKYRDQFQDRDLNHIPGDYYTNADCRYGPTDRALGPDGILDDCTGDLLPPPFVPPGTPEPPIDDDDLGLGFAATPQPDGFPDLYIQNPFWGEVFQVGNFNSSDYEAYVLEIVRRQYRGWELQGSYAWSRSTGDGEDFGQGIGDDRSLVDTEYGYQSQDQRHVVKLNATTVTPWGVRLGTAVIWQSGLPYSVILRKGAMDAVPPPLGAIGLPAIRSRTSFPDGLRNSGRNIDWWNVNARITREMNLPRGQNLQLSAEVYNLLDSRVLQIYNPATESGLQVNGVNESRVTTGRSYQLTGKLTF